jgi:DNA-binding MarR family transcriptional regulator
MTGHESSTLRELVRILVRHLGILEKSDLSCCGVSLAQCHAIVEIGRKGKINLNDLADLMGVDKSTMSRTINNLVESGLAARDLDNDDRRYVVIQLTEDGRRFFENTETGMERYFQSVLERIPEDKRGQVLESLTLLTAAIGNGRCC